MSKKNLFSHAAIYFLFFVNTVYAAEHGFHWLYWISALFVAAVIVFDVLEVLRRVRK